MKIVKSRFPTHLNLVGGLKWNTQDWKWRLRAQYPAAILGIVDSLVFILTFGYLNTGFQLKWLYKVSRKRGKRWRNENE